MSKSIYEIKKNNDEKMEKTTEKYKEELSKVKTGRANPSILEHIKIDYYGNPTLINQVANLSILDSSTISVQPWEASTSNAIEKAIRDSNLGLNPTIYGNIIKVPVPPLTEERRKELVKVMHGYAEDAKIALRNIRRDANNSIKTLLKDKECAEDEAKKIEHSIQDSLDKFIKLIDQLTDNKEKELLKV